MSSGGSGDVFQMVLEAELPEPLYLSQREVRGEWRSLFPRLAATLVQPYPIYAEADDTVVVRGYPVLLSAGVRRLHRDLEQHVADEVGYRLASGDERSAGRRAALAHRRRYTRTVAGIFEKALVNDYGRGLFDVFLLAHSADVAASLASVPLLVRQCRGGPRGRARGRRGPVEEIRVALAQLFADLLQQAAERALDSLRGLSHVRVAAQVSPLHTILCQDQLLLLEHEVPASLNAISGYLRARLGVDAKELLTSLEGAAGRLGDIIAAQPEVGDVLALVTDLDLDHGGAALFLEPRLLDALEVSAVADRLGLSPARRKTMRDLGLRLKCFELLQALRRRVIRLQLSDGHLHLAGHPERTIAATTRPLDFASAAIVSSTVRRFGLVYDLKSFTQTLGEVRKQGRQEEERSLRFMFVFQEKIEEIRRRRRLTFEKFLGDGAFYSARRGERVLAAACEIQRLYDQLIVSGFPFDQGLRIAMNYGSYQLLPMSTGGTGTARFEFFGHGIVELARLTTGKSTREIEEIAEFLVHSGYDPGQVDAFLAPLMAVRGGGNSGHHRRYSVTLDQHGELVNEGIVLTLPFLSEVEEQMSDRPLWVAESGDLKWLLFEVDPGQPESLYVGLRALGVARLKGLQPTELLEAEVWTERPPKAEEIAFARPLITVLRRLAATGLAVPQPRDERPIPADLVVLSFEEKSGRRRWIFGHYRDSDDVLLHAFNVPIQAAGLENAESVEAWLFQHRHDLRQVYDGLRRTASGVSTPLNMLRHRPGYVACYLASPHRALE